MDIKVQEVPSPATSLIKQFDVEVPHAVLAERMDKAVKELAPKVDLKGFRKGHVPEAHVRERYGEELMRDVVQGVIAESSSEALKDKGLELAAQPHANLNSEIKDLLQGKDLKYKITAELQPQFELMDVKTLELEKITTEIKEDHITAALNSVAERNPIFEEEEAGRPAQEDDKVIVDIVGTVDGKPFENNESKDMPIHLGKKMMMENIEKALMGKSAGDEFNVPIGFPADHPNKAIAGKLADFSVNLKSVRAQRPPVIDDTFAKAFGEESVDAMRTKVRAEMTKNDENTARTNLKEQIADKLSTHDFELPPSLLQHEKDSMMQQIASMQQNLPPEEQQKALAQMPQIERNIATMAEKRVKIALVLSRIAKDEKIEVSRDELKAAIEADIRSYGAEAQRIQKLYSENPELAQRLYAQQLEEKTIDHIIKVAKIKEKPMDREELYRQDEKNMPPAGDAKQSLTDLGA